MTVGYATTNPCTNEAVETFPGATDASVVVDAGALVPHQRPHHRKEIDQHVR